MSAEATAEVSPRKLARNSRNRVSGLRSGRRTITIEGTFWRSSMSHEAHVWRFHRTGAPEVLRCEMVPIPEPGPGEIRMRVEAIGVGFGECLYRMGSYVQETKLP